MNLENFIKIRPNVYHLTDSNNIDSILRDRKVLSTEELVKISDLEGKKKFLTTRREDHEIITSGNQKYYIRDQYPLNLKILGKCLEGNCTIEQFVGYLNSKVFFWGKMAGLKSHYARYIAQNESPVILRFDTKDLFDLNAPPKFTRLNSGAPRASSYLGGKGSPRGLNTFLPAEQFEHGAGSVNEVVFDKFAILPNNIMIGKHPDGPFKKI